MDKIKEYRVVKKLKELVKDYPASIYLVGGCVRDYLLESKPEDYDICIDQENGSILFCEWLKKNHGDRCTNFRVYPKYGTAKFELGLGKGKGVIEIECAMPRTETYSNGPRKPDSVSYATLEEDAMRRDFCCNALYYDIKKNIILDPTKYGQADIRNKVIRTTKDPRQSFREDPLRMLRAVRFCNNLDFILDPKTEEEMKDWPEYYTLSLDRVREEFTKMMTSKKNQVDSIRDLHKYKLLSYIIPELEESWGFDQNNHHHNLNLTEHTMKVLEGSRMVGLKENILRLKLAALLHDISKYRYHDVNRIGEFSYHGHEIKSAEMAKKILERLGYDKKTIDVVTSLIENHMILKPYYDYTTQHYKAKDKTTLKIGAKIDQISQETGNNIFITQLMTLIEADNLAHHPDSQMPRQKDDFIETWCRLKDSVPPTSRFKIDGKRLISEFGLSGKSIGEAKEIILGWLKTGEDTEVEEAIQRYKTEFYDTSDKIWLWVDFISMIRTDLSEPEVMGSGHKFSNNSYITIKPEELRPGDIPKDNENKIVSPKDYPRLYMKLKKHIKSRQILKEVWDKLEEMRDLGELEEMDFVMDDYGDFRGTIRWSDFIDHII